jgi:hypothetical protein
MWLIVGLLLAFTGCADRGAEGCAGESDPVVRENCRFDRAAAAYSVSREHFLVEIATIEQAESRDLVRLRLAIQDPVSAAALCAEVETDAASEKCRQVLGRPHLQHAGGRK